MSVVIYSGQDLKNDFFYFLLPFSWENIFVIVRRKKIFPMAYGEVISKSNVKGSLRRLWEFSVTYSHCMMGTDKKFNITFEYAFKYMIQFNSSLFVSPSNKLNGLLLRLNRVLTVNKKWVCLYVICEYS